MPYHCVVCVKQVPDTANVTAQAMKEDGTVNRAALPAVFNPDDLYALEAALQVRDRYGGTVTVLTMGPPKAGDVLRECLYRGADRVVLLTDRRAAASDTLATSYILSQAVRATKNYDFVFCGRQAIDGDTAQVGPQLAEKLGIPQVTYVEELIEVRDRSARVRRNVGNGWEVVEVRLPVLLTVLDTASEPRPPAARRVMKYKRARARVELEAAVKGNAGVSPAPGGTGVSPVDIEHEVERLAEGLRSRGLMIEQWNLDDIQADLSWCGLHGSPTKVHRIQAIVLTKQGYTEVPPTEDGIRSLIRELVVDHTLG
ncbi:MAG: electron transfer flavoprotein subunit beta/FixA family protein [Planctomycetota bacterium]